MHRVKQLLESETPRKWIFYGDSITHGALHTFGLRDYVELFSERLRTELGRVMDVVITTANNGDNTRGLLASFDWRIGQFGPDVVFIMIGMNDCSANNDIGPEEFEANLNRLADRLQEIGAVAVLQTTCPILPGQAPDRAPHFDTYMDLVRQVAARRDLPLVDHTRFWQEHPDSHFYWMSNAFHPNGHGHRAFAAHLYHALGMHDPSSHSCRLHIP